MTTLAIARSFTYEALDDIREALSEAAGPADFLAAVDALVQEPGKVLELPVNLGAPLPLDPGGSRGSGRDVDNASRVYEYLGVMDRANAADPRLWTYLALVTYRDYMSQRWSLDDVKDWKNRALDRWLVRKATRGVLVRHGVARLWWIAALTHDPLQEYALSKRDSDQHAYTRAIMQHEDWIINVFDREASAVPGLVVAVMDHVASEASRSTDAYVRRLMKELTLVFGFRDLAVLGVEGLRSLVDQLVEPTAA